MKFTLSWLKEYLDTSASLSEITDKLTAIGLEVEVLHDPAKMLEGFVVGHVMTAEKHPDADKLRCLVVDTGKEKLKVVCGAPNARAGMKGVFAPAGSYIPGSDMTLKKTQIRGQESNGMMCSERELLLSDEHSGIIELPETCETGSPASIALGQTDPVIEINLTPNRGDCAGIYGIARDLAAAGIGKLKTPATTETKGAFKSPVSLSIQDTKGCTLFIGRYFKGVKNGASPAWLQQRLKSIGLRPISTLVDITNYLTIGLNRPAHVFDADKLKGNIHVRAAKAGETLAALNDKTYALEKDDIAVCDDGGVLALGGIMGGVSTGVSDATKNVFLEIACFDPARIAKTGQRLQIDSDARYRFERGIDSAFAKTGAETATQIILDLCGGEASEAVLAGESYLETYVISYDPALLKKRGGSDLPLDRQKNILTALGFKVQSKESLWHVQAPSWRHDVTGAADLVEEILRIDGYDNIPPVHVRPTAETPKPELGLLQRRAKSARRALAMRGFHETITWSFMEDAKSDLFGAHHHQKKKALTLVNPISADLAVMRPSILPNLIDAAAKNTDRGYPDAHLFEVGNVYFSPEHDGQTMVASGLRSGDAATRHWSQTARKTDALDTKGDALAVLDAAGINTQSLQITRDAPNWYHPGRSGALRLGPTVLAYFGEIHPAILEKLKRDEAMAGFEVFLEKLPAPKKKSARKELLKPPPFQPLYRDFAFIVDQNIESEKLIRAVKVVDKALIASVEVFDIYSGKGVDAGKKSIAIAVTIQPSEKTLTEDEINILSVKITENVKKETNGILRA